jgi:hypothetical protein
VLAEQLPPLMPQLFQAADTIGTILLFLGDFDGEFGELMADLAKAAGPVFDAIFLHVDNPHPFIEVLGMLPAELSGTVGEIRIPDVVTAREYDLVCICSPTWWLSTNVPIRSFLESETAGRVLKGKRFAVAVICRRYWRHNLNTVRRLATWA